MYPDKVFPYPLLYFSEDGHRFKGEGHFRSGLQDYSINDISKEEIIQHLSSEYTSHLDHLNRQR